MAILLNGFVLGWSVAWPPGPVNAEMIRRGLVPKDRGGGFWSTWQVGLGACTGDFIWALGVSLGAGALLSSLSIRRGLGVVSFCLLIFLAWTFVRSAWQIYRSHRAAESNIASDQPKRRGYWLGLFFALSSPWNIGFWFAVIGSQTTQLGGVQRSLALAASVVLGAVAWTLVLCAALKLGARIFSRPEWQIMTEALTSLVMIWFAARLLLHFP
ncbi:MAG TPA: LysE family transporter [Chthoniobacterales bacterium]|nr:LysE family transporter [Chthoniobacterales bacterium]